jgi:hypothetical protein
MASRRSTWPRPGTFIAIGFRRKRKAFFRDLDARQLRAVVAGQGDAIANIEAAKQALREAPADPGIDAAQTPDELKSVWPLPSA